MTDRTNDTNESANFANAGSLADPRVCRALDRLHADAGRDWRRMLRVLPVAAWGLLRGRSLMQAISPTDMKDVYIPVSRDLGKFLYFLARVTGAQQIVEFGASFGISTVYLAAAARDNGGQVLSTEIEPSKCEIARDNLRETGLGEHVRLLEGDALETLAHPDEQSAAIDLVFLDGWKDLYVPVLELLKPRLAKGAVIVADNVNFRDAHPYVAVVRAPDSGFVSSVMFGGTTEISHYTNGKID